MNIDEALDEENVCIRRHRVTFQLSEWLVWFYLHSYTLHIQFL